MVVTLSKAWRRAPVMALVCLFWVGFGGSEAALACDKLWVKTDPGSWSWHVDAHWEPSGVPGPTDVACIQGDGMYQVVVDQPVTIGGLALDVMNGLAQLRVVAVEFTLDGLGLIDGDTKLKVNDNGLLQSNSGGSLEVRSTLVIEGGVVDVDVDLYGHLNWTDESSITGSLVCHPGSRKEVESPVAEAHLTVVQGFENRGELIFNDSIAQSLTVLNGSLVNGADGTISTRTGTPSRR